MRKNGRPPLVSWDFIRSRQTAGKVYCKFYCELVMIVCTALRKVVLESGEEEKKGKKTCCELSVANLLLEVNSSSIKGRVRGIKRQICTDPRILDSGRRNKMDLKRTLDDLRNQRDLCEFTVSVLRQMRVAYAEQHRQSEIRVQILHDERERLTPEGVGCRGSRQERSRQMADHLRVIQEQQRSPRDAAVLQWGPPYPDPHCLSGYRAASRTLERTLEIQSRLLRRRELCPTAFSRLKNHQIEQESHYGVMLSYLEEIVARWVRFGEFTIATWNERIRQVEHLLGRRLD